jgi:hypothetical protein
MLVPSEAGGLSNSTNHRGEVSSNIWSVALVGGGVRGSTGSCATAKDAEDNNKASVNVTIHSFLIYMFSPNSFLFFV